jgi:hypothetical protein
VFSFFFGDENLQPGHKEMEGQLMQMGFFSLFFVGEKNESKSPHYGGEKHLKFFVFRQ